VKHLVSFTFCLFCCYSVSAQTVSPPTPRPKPAAAPAKSKVEMAVWNQTVLDTYGMSEQAFISMGFGKLTTKEFKDLIDWLIVRDFASKNMGMDEGRQAGLEEGRQAAASSAATYSCGPNKTNIGDLSKVNVFIDDHPDAPAELMSGVRQRLRNMSDVQIVFDRKEADLIVSILAYENRTHDGSAVLGYNASTTVLAPCTWKNGGQTGTFSMYEDGFLQSTGRDPSSLVDKIVSSIDTHNIETVRAINSAYRKALQTPKQ